LGKETTRSGNMVAGGSDIFAGTAEGNVWHHLLQTYSNDEYKCYDNGVLVNTTSYSNLNLGYGGIYIGNIVNDYDYWNGYLAAARIYDRALTQDEIDTLASEFTVQYEITAQDLTFSLYQKNETYGISYSSAMTPVTFDIIEGSLPNTISFNTSTGQFSGKGLTDADHTYNLKVRLTAPNSIPATCNVTIYTYKTARINLYNQSFSFISNKAESKSISYTSDESVTFTVESGTLPAGMTMTTGGTFSSSGTNTSADTQQVVVRATSANNQTGVTATMTLDMQMNAVVLNAQTMKFYTAQGAKTEAVKYSGSLNEVTDAVFSMTGTLPTGVTWDATTGSFTSDGTQTADEIASVSVTVSSSSGTSTAATASVTLEVHLGGTSLPDDYVFYMPMTSISNFESTDANVTVTNKDEAYPVEFTTQDGIDCAYFYGSVDRSLKVNNISNSWPFAGTGRTISLWVKCAALSNQGQGALWYGNAYGNANCIWVGVFGTNEFGLDTYNGGLTNNVVSGELPVVSDLNWHHYAITVYNNESGKLHGCVYADGIMSIEGGWNAYALDTTVSNVAFIGGYSDQLVWSKTLNGYIAGFRVYDRVLDDSEIQALASEFTPIPTSGLVMYHPLSEVSLTPSIGSVFELAGTAPSATIEDGIPCLLFNNGAYKQANTNYWNYNSPIITLSIWGKCLNTSNAAAFATGRWAYNDAFEIMKETYWKCVSAAEDIASSSAIDITKWHHLCATLDKTTNTGKFYIDGNLIGETTYSINLTNNVVIGANADGSGYIPRDSWFYGYLAAARIYDRVLTDEEIAMLASEFTA